MTYVHEEEQALFLAQSQLVGGTPGAGVDCVTQRAGAGWAAATARAVALWGQRYGAQADAVVDTCRRMGLPAHAVAAGPPSDEPATSHARAG